jgi:hypothetical protein
MHEQCKLEAEDLENILNIFMIAHCLSFFATAYREMYSAQTNLGGQLMRIIEVICIPVLFTAILSAIEMVTLSLVRLSSADNIANSDPSNEAEIDDKTDYNQVQEVGLAALPRKLVRVDDRRIAHFRIFPTDHGFLDVQVAIHEGRN